jgi:hypothetical protein
MSEKNAPISEQEVNEALRNEIADLIGIPDTKAGEVVEQPKVEDKPVEPIVEEKKSEEPKPPEGEKESEPEVPHKVDEEEAKEAETEEEGEKEEPDEDLTSFRKQLNEMALKSIGPDESVAEKKKDEKPAAEVVEKKADERPSIPMDKKLELSEEEFDTAISGRKGFNDVVLSRVDKVVEERAKAVVENRITDLIRTLPGSIGDMVRTIVDLRIATHQFYDRNKDLKDFRPFISLVGNEIMAKNPDKSIDEVFVLVEQEVRKRLRLSPREVVGQKVQKPAFVNSVRSRKPQPQKLDGLKAEIADLLTH